MDIKTLTGCTSSTIISYIKGQPIAYSQQTQSTVVAGGLLLEFRFFYVTIMPLKFFGLLQCARKQVSLVSQVNCGTVWGENVFQIYHIQEMTPPQKKERKMRQMLTEMKMK